MFLCMGNICRSPLAEAVFRSHLAATPTTMHTIRSSTHTSAVNNESYPIHDISSAGTDAYHVGSSPDDRTIAVLKAKGVREEFYKDQRSTKISLRDFWDHDYILVMDNENLGNAQELARQAKAQGEPSGRGDRKGRRVGKVMLLGDFGGQGEDEEIVDPYYDGGSEGFEKAFEQCDRCSRGFLRWLVETTGQGP